MSDTGPPTQVGDVHVIGVRAEPGQPKPGAGSGAGGESGGETQNEVGQEDPTSPGGVYTQAEADEENRRQDECAAKDFDDEVVSRGDRGDEVEHFSVTWKRGGTTVTSEVREATGRNGDMPVGSAVSSSDFNRLSRDYGGIPLSQISGFNHSHAANLYCDGDRLLLDSQRRENQRPSENDWAFADVLPESNTSHGLVLYLRDCEGVVRGFPYVYKDAFRNGSRPTPDPIAPADCDDAE